METVVIAVDRAAVSKVHAIESVNRSDACFSFSGGEPTWVGKVEHGVTLGAKLNALMRGWQEATRPQRRVTLRFALHKHHESGQVLVLRSKSVGSPRTESRPTDVFDLFSASFWMQ